MSLKLQRVPIYELLVGRAEAHFFSYHDNHDGSVSVFVVATPATFHLIVILFVTTLAHSMSLRPISSSGILFTIVARRRSL